MLKQQHEMIKLDFIALKLKIFNSLFALLQSDRKMPPI